MEYINITFVVSTAVMLFLIMDPLGNLPVFVSILRHFSDADYRRIVFRESLAALAVMLLFLFFGNRILELLHVSTVSLGIAGGIILFMIAIKMVFGTHTPPEANLKEPLLVPLAIPLFAGPSVLTVLILIRGTPDATLPACLTALFLTWMISAAILTTGRFWERVIGTKVLAALEALMGFLLTVVAVEMLIHGIREAFPGICPPVG